jgi:hypothetical protein
MSDQQRITLDASCRVRYNPNCPGGGKPHHSAEDGARVLVSVINHPGDHTVCGNYKGAPWATIMPPEGGLGVGRYFRPDELEVLAPGAIDPTPADYAERRARLRARMELPC